MKKLVLFSVLCSVILLLMPMVSSVETKLVEDEKLSKDKLPIGGWCLGIVKYLYTIDNPSNIVDYDIYV